MQVVEMKENGGAALAAGEKAPQLGVKRGEPTLVPPAEATPTGGQYYLSNLDQNIAVIVQTVYCYKPSGGGGDVAAALRGALARVLVHYYPLAGRLGVSPEMKLTVELTGEGAVFVEADAACELATVGDLTKPDPAALGQLVYSVPGAKHILEMPPMTAQVLALTASLARFRLNWACPVGRPTRWPERVGLCR
jgi:omega-hydroxypalmitate O-feruloyl transferase